jgi:hypothetical protein
VLATCLVYQSTPKLSIQPPHITQTNEQSLDEHYKQFPVIEMWITSSLNYIIKLPLNSGVIFLPYHFIPRTFSYIYTVNIHISCR